MSRCNLQPECHWARPDDEADPVFWYPSLATGQPVYCFYDEHWQGVHGLYPSEDLCREALKTYGDQL
jgi:hypothetical protein